MVFHVEYSRVIQERKPPASRATVPVQMEAPDPNAVKWWQIDARHNASDKGREIACRMGAIFAVRSGVAISTIRRLEGLKGAPIGAHFETIDKIRCAFEKAGIEFIGNPCPGVRLRTEAL